MLSVLRMRPGHPAWALALFLTAPALSTTALAAHSPQAGSGNSTAPPALTAKTLAGRVDHHYNALHSLSVNFTQEYNGMGMHRHESGTLLLRKPGKMRWTYSQPAGKLFLLDGHDAWFYTPGSSEVPRIAASKLDDFRSPLRFLLGHTNLDRDFTHLQLTPATDGNYDLSSIPKGMEQRITALTLHLTADGTILGMKIEETDDAITLFTFTGERPNTPTRDDDFTWRPIPGTTIINGLPPI